MISEIIISTKKSEILTECRQGPAGPPGAAGADGINGNTAPVIVTSGESLGGGRVVKVVSDEAFYASSDETTDIDKIVGVTQGASTIGNDSSIQHSGEMVDPAWTFTEGPLYLGTNGLITQTVPATGIVQQVGVAVTSTKIVINIQQGILRG